jgi:hypothetical protein
MAMRRLVSVAEVMAYLRANGFKTYIVSGGGVDFMRVFSEWVLGGGTKRKHRSTSDSTPLGSINRARWPAEVASRKARMRAVSS